MKVMCVKEPRRIQKGATNRIEVGGIYEVVDQIVKNDIIYFELSIHLNFAYNSHLFAPLSDIDETEMVRDRELAGV